MAANLYVEDGYVESGWIQSGITVNWPTYEIFIPKATLTLIQSAPTEIRQLNLMEFKEILGDRYDDPDGRLWPIPFKHNEDVTVGGVTLADVLEILPPYTVTFEDGQYAVNLVGANSNVGDRVNVNQVSVRSTNSAGLQNIDTITSLAYSQGVFIDTGNITGKAQSGTSVPIGTQGTPSDNWQDAKDIANYQNTSVIVVLGNASLGAGDDVSNMTVTSNNAVTNSLTVAPEAITDNLFVKSLYFTGSLDGGSTLRDCILGDISYFNGYIFHCAFTSSNMEINGHAIILDCFAGATNTSHPSFDLLNATGFTMRNFDGDIGVSNIVNDIRVHISMTGHLDLLTNCTLGTIELHGDAGIEGDFTGVDAGTLILEDATTGTPQEIAQSVWSNTERTLTEAAGLTAEESALIARTAYMEARVYVDTEAGVNGDGSQVSPFNVFNDGKDYAEAEGIYVLVVHGEVTIQSNFRNFTVYGIGTPKIITNGQDLRNSKFFQCTMEGTYTEKIVVQESVLLDGFALDGFFENCMLAGDLTCNAGTTVLVANCFSGIAGLNRPSISMNTGGATQLSIRNYSGGLNVTDCDHVDDTVTVEVSQGSLTFTNTCVAGTMVARGLCKFVDETAGATVVDETSYNSIVGVEDLRDYNEGEWEITGNQMIFYRRDGSELQRFNLLDAVGNPTSKSVYKRENI